ncbi:MAG: EamA family transporter [Planctomycetales bacterium]|nr:EamA family transporter [Planctomycetales bacterium]
MSHAEPKCAANSAQDTASELARDGWLGRLQIVLAGVMWSTSGFFAKSPWFDAWPEDLRGLMLAFWRSFFAVVVLLPLIRRPSLQWQMLPMSVCFAVMVWSFMSAMVHGPAANAIWLQYLCPVWVLIAGVTWLGERVTAADVRMFVCCLTGVALILCVEMWGGSNLYATGMGLLSGVSFAGVVLSIRSLPGADPAWLIAINHGVTALILAPWVIGRSEAVGAIAYLALGLFGVFQMSIPYILFARGLRTTSSPEASVLTLVEPILVPVWVFIAWRSHPSYEPPSWSALAGGSLILLGLLIRYVPALLRARRSAITISDEGRV